MIGDIIIRDGIVTIEGDKENLSALEKVTRINAIIRSLINQFDSMKGTFEEFINKKCVVLDYGKFGEGKYKFSELRERFMNDKDTVFAIKRGAGTHYYQTIMFITGFNGGVDTPATDKIYATGLHWTYTNKYNYYILRGTITHDSDDIASLTIDNIPIYPEDYQFKYNLTQEINSSSSDDEYPSAKAVYDSVLSYLESVADDVVDLQGDVVNINNELGTIEGILTDNQRIIDRALVTPVSTPTEKMLTGVDTTNTQIMAKVGDGLELEGGTSPYTLKCVDNRMFINVVQNGGDYDLEDATFQTILDAINNGKTVYLVMTITALGTTKTIFRVSHISYYGTSLNEFGTDCVMTSSGVLKSLVRHSFSSTLTSNKLTLVTKTLS